MMQRLLLLSVIGLAINGDLLIETARADDAPQKQIVAIYFHRTQRCPTCKKMGAYTQQAIKSKFAEELKKKEIVLHFVDFQDAKNAKLAKAYKITGPALIVAKIKERKVDHYENLTEIWSNVGDKQKFMKYVQDKIAALIEK